MKTGLFTALLFVTTNIFAQESLLTWNEKQPLQWSDFAGNTKDTSRFDAESFAEVRYNYKRNQKKGLDFEVSANFNKNISWCRKGYQSEALLKHEQLHFDIAELFARKLKQAFEEHQYSSNYQAEIQEIFNEIKVSYHQMQHRYDEETNHSLITDKQKQWGNLVYEGLTQLKQIAEYAKNK